MEFLEQFGQLAPVRIQLLLELQSSRLLQRLLGLQLRLRPKLGPELEQAVALEPELGFAAAPELGLRPELRVVLELLPGLLLQQGDPEEYLSGLRRQLELRLDSELLAPEQLGLRLDSERLLLAVLQHWHAELAELRLQAGTGPDCRKSDQCSWGSPRLLHGAYFFAGLALRKICSCFDAVQLQLLNSWTGTNLSSVLERDCQLILAESVCSHGNCFHFVKCHGLTSVRIVLDFS